MLIIGACHYLISFILLFIIILLLTSCSDNPLYVIEFKVFTVQSYNKANALLTYCNTHLTFTSTRTRDLTHYGLALFSSDKKCTPSIIYQAMSILYPCTSNLKPVSNNLSIYIYYLAYLKNALPNSRFIMLFILVTIVAKITLPYATTLVIVPQSISIKSKNTKQHSDFVFFYFLKHIFVKGYNTK